MSISRYTQIAGVVVLASLARIPFSQEIGDRVPFITLFPAIVYSAWIGGLGGGIAATFLSTIIAILFIMPHQHGLPLDRVDAIELLRFCVVGLVISALGEAKRRAHSEARVNALKFQHSVAAVKEAEALCSAIVESALDCVITIDEHGRVVEWNPAAVQTFGYSRDTAIGQPLSELIVPARFREAHSHGIGRFLATGEGPVLNRRVEIPALRANGEEFCAELTVIPIKRGSGYIFTAYLRDITERETFAEQRRTLLRDMLLSVTDGKLHLCNDDSELPDKSQSAKTEIVIATSQALSELRGLVSELCRAYEFASDRQMDFVSAVSEAAMNAVVHGGGGTATLLGDDGTRALQVRIVDHGMGIAMDSIPQATLARGYSTKATLGHGLKLIIELVDRVYLLTGPNGTTVVLEKDREQPLPFWLEG